MYVNHQQVVPLSYESRGLFLRRVAHTLGCSRDDLVFQLRGAGDMLSEDEAFAREADCEIVCTQNTVVDDDPHDFFAQLLPADLPFERINVENVLVRIIGHYDAREMFNTAVASETFPVLTYAGCWKVYDNPDFPTADLTIDRGAGVTLQCKMAVHRADNYSQMPKIVFYRKLKQLKGRNCKLHYIDVTATNKEIVFEYRHDFAESVEDLCTQITQLFHIEKNIVVQKQKKIGGLIKDIDIRMDIFSDIIMNDKLLKSNIYIKENIIPLSTRKKHCLHVNLCGTEFLLSIKPGYTTKFETIYGVEIEPNTHYCIFKLSRPSDPDCYNLFCHIVLTLCKCYLDHKDEVMAVYRDVLGATYETEAVADTPLSPLHELRKNFKGIIKPGYSRKANVKPVVIPVELVEEYHAMGYKTMEFHSKVVGCPPGMYPGVKVSNPYAELDKQELIPVCYMTDHRLRTNSIMSQFLTSNAETRKKMFYSNSSRIITVKDGRGVLSNSIRKILDPFEFDKLFRIGIKHDRSSFLNCFGQSRAEILARTETLNDVFFEVCKQELWYLSTDDIKRDFSDPSVFIDPDKFYRLLEELYDCNIYVINIFSSTDVSLSVPPCKGDYLWEERAAPAVVVLCYRNILDIETDYPHCEVVSSDAGIFLDPQCAVSKNLARLKRAQTTRIRAAPHLKNLKNARGQLINEIGKCVAVLLDANFWVPCYERPRWLRECAFREDALPPIKTFSSKHTYDIRGSGTRLIGYSQNGVYTPVQSTYIVGMQGVTTAIDLSFHRNFSQLNDYSLKKKKIYIIYDILRAMYKSFIENYHDEDGKEVFVQKYTIISHENYSVEFAAAMKEFDNIDDCVAYYRQHYAPCFAGSKIKIDFDVNEKLLSIMASVNRNDNIRFLTAKFIHHKKVRYNTLFTTDEAYERWRRNHDDVLVERTTLDDFGKDYIYTQHGKSYLVKYVGDDAIAQHHSPIATDHLRIIKKGEDILENDSTLLLQINPKKYYLLTKIDL